MYDLGQLNTATMTGTSSPSATGARRPHRGPGRNLRNRVVQ